jgi:phosphoribosylformylglycinamidine cyclo-ligase
MEHTYAAAGVSLDAADAVVERLRAAVASTRTPGVLESHGGFAGLYALAGYRDPVLVSGADGVGTKLALLREAGRLRVAGVDCVAMCVNDVLTTGARPLFFLDYVSCGRLDPDHVADLVEGVADGCRIAGCALLGGETAEHPGVQAPDELEIAGFCVGACERGELVDGSTVEPGDAIVGLASTGLHANGFSLVRHLLAASGLTVADAPADLLAPTAIYAADIAVLRESIDVGAMCHVTGGGIAGNLPRVLPDGIGATLDAEAWPEPPVFSWLRSLGVADAELRRVFNCGLGYLVVVRRATADAAVRALVAGGRAAWVVGEASPGSGVQFAED